MDSEGNTKHTTRSNYVTTKVGEGMRENKFLQQFKKERKWVFWMSLTVLLGNLFVFINWVFYAPESPMSVLSVVLSALFILFSLPPIVSRRIRNQISANNCFGKNKDLIWYYKWINDLHKTGQLKTHHEFREWMTVAYRHNSDQMDAMELVFADEL